MTRKLLLLWAVATLTAALCSMRPALADFTRLGNTLIGTGAVGAALQGSVALSGNGNTAIVGGNFDNSKLGAAWVFTRIPGGNWVQQGAKLLGGNAVGAAEQGSSVTLSADGNTAIVGGRDDNSNVGAAWIFTRSGGTWTQQGLKLVGSNSAGAAHQGFSVALSGDGNTTIIGGPNDNNDVGAVWVFARSNGVWTEQVKLIGTGAAGSTQQGYSVALSGDGNTAIVGGAYDNSSAGAVWVFVRGSGGWTQQGAKLVGTGAVGAAFQGAAVALSGDGNTAMVGGPGDNSGAGAVWVFTRTGGVWTQQGSKLVCAGAVGAAGQGNSVALSLDGNTAIVGGPADNGNAGAAWALTRSGATWSQLGSKLTAFGHSDVAFSVALSGDGNTALLGAPGDNSNIGGAFPFVQPGAEIYPAATHDFDTNGASDIAWRHSGGAAATWLMQYQAGSVSISQAGNFGVIPGSWHMVGQRDFNNDGTADLLWRDDAGNVAIWLMNGTAIQSTGLVGNVPTAWTIVGTGDFNNDGKADILWRDSSGNVAIWLMNSTTIQSSTVVGNVSATWTIVGTGDFNGDGRSDILWRDSSGNVAMWLMNGTTIQSSAVISNVPTAWTIVGSGDFNGDGMADILWRDSSGNVAAWLMNGTNVLQTGTYGVVAPNWQIAETGDLNVDGMTDILWRDTTGGSVAYWLIGGFQISSSGMIGAVGTDWSIQSLNAE